MKPITLKKSVKIAVDAIEAQCQKLAVHANLWEQYHWEGGKKASETREDLMKAKQMLLELVKSADDKSIS